MDARQERGAILARDRRVKKVEGVTWLVPSQNRNDGAYVVNTLAGTCSCPDHEARRVKCKHLWAVELSQTVETTPEGVTVTTETIKVTRKTYAQDWPNYNAAQCAEKGDVQTLLRSLCDGIQNPPHAGRGPKPVPVSDAVYGMVMKVYTTVSGRRATTDIEACADAGHLAKAPRYNTLFDCMGKPEMTSLLTSLIEESAAPLQCVESKFAVDSTGFGTAVYRRWYDAKYGHEKKEHAWLKAHAMVGVQTNVITAVHVTDSGVQDGTALPGLVKATDKRFGITEVSADKAYLTRRNLDAIEEAHGVPYIPFKSNSKMAGPAAWRRMWGLFMYRQPEFQAHYNLRSNVETTFSALKRKFGGAVRSKTFTAQVNEILCKVLCHNLAVLVHAQHELGLAPFFGAPDVQVAS